jgi:hypothetical protein
MLQNVFFRNLRIFVISYSVYPSQAFSALSNKHSSLLQKLVIYEQKRFITLGPVPSTMGKNISAAIYKHSSLFNIISYEKHFIR